MKKSVKKALYVWVSLILFLGFMEKAEAYASTFHIDAHESTERVVSLTKGDDVYGRINVVGASNGGIVFYVNDPDGQTILRNDNCLQQDFQFSAGKNGDYVFHFDNTAGETTVTVTFEYNTRRYIFGFPQEMILLFIVAGVLFLAVVAFALSAKR